MKQYANLHLHSTHSDGVYTPAELVRIAKDEGYRALSLTDHDTTTGNSDMRRECEAAGLDFIFGCEFSSPWRERRINFHIVGFDFDPEYPEMKEYLAQRSFCEAEQTRILFERGLAEGLLHDITWDEVLAYNKGVTWLCNNHVFETMKAKGLVTDLDYMNFFHTVYGKRRGEVKPPYEFKPIDKMLRLIRDAGGFAVVAHPHRQLHAIPELIEMGLSGLEVWHHLLTPEERLEALKIAKEHKLFISGGSDHDGLCGGYYSSFENPEESQFYVPECSCGTQEIFFREIKTRTLDPERDAVIEECISIEKSNR